MLEGQFSSNWRSFARQYAMLPGDAARGYRPDPNTETQLDGVFEGFRHTQMSPGQKIATVTMTKGPTSRGDAVSVRASLAGAGLPVYFLPWDARGAAVEMTIPSRNPDLPERTHPRFFFTAVLSGCSVFFRGNRQYPTIYHCGTSGKTGGGAPTEGESNAFFDRLLKTARFLGVGARPSGRAKMVRSTDYMVTKASGASPELEQLTAREAAPPLRGARPRGVGHLVGHGFRRARGARLDVLPPAELHDRAQDVGGRRARGPDPQEDLEGPADQDDHSQVHHPRPLGAKSQGGARVADPGVPRRGPHHEYDRFAPLPTLSPGEQPATETGDGTFAAW